MQETVDWSAAFVGLIEPGKELDEELAHIDELSPKLPLIVQADSPAAKHLLSRGRHAFHPVDFPIRYSQLSEILQQLGKDKFPRLRTGINTRLVGSSAAMRRVNGLIRQVARFDTSVLILGESGTGKELVARTIHELSPRRDKPFVAINCGAIPAELLESELYGHEKGAFTGAIATRKGRFEIAEGGTLFLDEIGDMSLPMQVKLLRVLQERIYERVGSNQLIHSDVRIIAATHRNLEAEIADGGNFREDLFYRLNVFPIEMPSLRQRLEDLPELIDEFSVRFSERGLETVTFVQDALATLAAYTWPGNVRELANLIERLAILYPGNRVRAFDLPVKYRANLICAATESTPIPFHEEQLFSNETIPLLSNGGVNLKDYLAEIEIRMIRQALSLSNGIVTQAAKLLNLQRTTLVEKLRKYGLQNGISMTEI